MYIYLGNDAVAKVLVVFTIRITADGVPSHPGITSGRKDSRAMGRLCLIRIVFGRAGANGRSQPDSRIWDPESHPLRKIYIYIYILFSYSFAGRAGLAPNVARWVRWANMITGQCFPGRPDSLDWLD